MAKLWELARLIRSKNAGPFLVTFDIMFDDEATYDAVVKSGVMNKQLFARVYGLPEDQVQFVEYRPGLAVKATIPRPVRSGDPTDGDVMGAQQHGPLVNLEVPVEAVGR